MKNLFLAMCLMGMSISVFAQKTVQETNEANVERVRQQQEENQRIERSAQTLRALQNPTETKLTPSIILYYPKVSEVSKENAALLKPERKYSEMFDAFLNTPKTGLVKISPDLGCVTKHIVIASQKCQKSIPERGYYSFRKTDYAIRDLSDIGIKNDFLVSEGLYQQGILVSLGDVPIETVSINSAGLKFLAEYQPAQTVNEVNAKTAEFDRGVSFDKYLYSNKAIISGNTTYAVRSIAYRGNILTKLYGNFFYNKLGSDKRVDIIAVFRILEKDANGNITLLWKELQRKESLKLKS